MTCERGCANCTCHKETDSTGTDDQNEQLGRVEYRPNKRIPGGIYFFVDCRRATQGCSDAILELEDYPHVQGAHLCNRPKRLNGDQRTIWCGAKSFFPPETPALTSEPSPIQVES